MSGAFASTKETIIAQHALPPQLKGFTTIMDCL